MRIPSPEFTVAVDVRTMVVSAGVVNKRYTKFEISNRHRNQLILENIRVLEIESCSRIGVIGISPIKMLQDSDTLIPEMSSKCGKIYLITIMQLTVLAKLLITIQMCESICPYTPNASNPSDP
jgi:hypothetical protein